MTTQPPTINGVDFAVGMDPVRAQIIRELHAATDRDKPDHALAQDARAADGHRLDQIADEQARRHPTYPGPPAGYTRPPTKEGVPVNESHHP